MEDYSKVYGHNAEAQVVKNSFNPLPTYDSYMRHGYAHFFHKSIRIYMGGLTLGINTLYVIFCFLGPFDEDSYGW